jgi:hypothetical protein
MVQQPSSKIKRLLLQLKEKFFQKMLIFSGEMFGIGHANLC